MKSILIAALALLMLASPASAQRFRSNFDSVSVDHPLEQLVAARAKLIKQYVLDNKYARGVSICGEDSPFDGSDHSWLTVYLYDDVTVNVPKEIDGISVVVVRVKRSKSALKRSVPNVNQQRQLGADAGEYDEGGDDFSEIC